jgi:hypothetical protein
MTRLALVAFLLLASAADALKFRTQLGGGRKFARNSAAAVAGDIVTLLATVPTASECTNANITTTQGGAVTVSRASSSYCQKSDNSYVLIGSNLPVVEPAGLRIEPAATNLVAYSTDLFTGWAATNVSRFTIQTDPMGGSSADQWDDTAAGGSLESPQFVVSSTSAVLSSWTYNEGGVNATLVLRDTTAGVDRCTITITAGSAFQTTMTGRASCSSSALVSGHNHVVQLFPGGVAGTGSGVSVWGVQVEAGSTTKTSYIATNGAAATRAADVITTTITSIAAAGCVSGTIKAVAPAFPQRLITAGADIAAINSNTAIFSSDATNTVFASSTDITGRSVPFRVQWGGTALRADLDGVTGTPGSFDGSMGAGATTMYLGSNSGVQVFNGWLKALKVGSSASGCL